MLASSPSAAASAAAEDRTGTSMAVAVEAKPTARSRVTNGKALFIDGDKRGRIARRFRDILAEIISDLKTTGGLSEGQRQLARRCALLSVQCELLEALAVVGEEIDLEAYGQLTDRLGRAFQRIGLKRSSKPVLNAHERMAKMLAQSRANQPPSPEEIEPEPYVENDEAEAEEAAAQDAEPNEDANMHDLNGRSDQ